MMSARSQGTFRAPLLLLVLVVPVPPLAAASAAAEIVQVVLEARPRPRPVTDSGSAIALSSCPKLSVPKPNALPPPPSRDLDDSRLHENLHARRVEVVDNLLERLPILRRRADNHRVGRGIGSDIYRIGKIDTLAGRAGRSGAGA